MRIAVQFSLLTLLLLTGCSAGGPPFQAPAAPQDKAVLWLFRPSTVVGAANTDYIAVNGKLAARLDVGEYTTVTVPPGPVVIKQKQVAPFFVVAIRVLQELGGFGEVLTFTAEPGRNYFIEFSEGDLVDTDRARSRIGSMSRVPPPATE